ncbi:MAG: hypothetical protein JWQ40_2249 [Segetibacter sp.]|jgi:tellurite resistance protein|nr:hypothetical protein [Segetibacter sp.]
MIQTGTIPKELYTRLGYLFYAMAIADGSIESAEIKKLKKTIKERWLPVEESVDEFGSPAAFQIISVFDWLEEKQIYADEAFDAFAVFLNKNRKLVDAEMKENILQTAVDISLAFGGENKNERAFVENLKKLLDKKA